MYITNTKGTFKIWNNKRHLVYQSESYEKIRYYINKYDENGNEYYCSCLLCKNGNSEMCYQMGSNTILQHCIDNQKYKIN